MRTLLLTALLIVLPGAARAEEAAPSQAGKPAKPEAKAAGKGDEAPQKPCEPVKPCPID